jgi:hypothetical protein
VNSIPPPRPMRVWEHVDRVRFLEEIRPLGEPAILRGIAAQWPGVAAARVSDESIVAYLSRFATDELAEMVVGPPEIEGRLSYGPDVDTLNFVRGRSPIRAFLDRLLRDRHEPKPYAIAMQSALIAKFMPGFELENLTDLPPAAVPPRIWIGNAICVATHADASENIAVNVAGRRRFTLFPPASITDLYVGPIEFTPAGPLTSLVHVTKPDLVRYPRFSRAMAVAQQAELSPGDAIYIPFHWWHHVESLDPINVLVNFWWNVPPSLYVASPLELSVLAMQTMRALPPDQRPAFEAMLRHYVLAEGGDPGGHIPPPMRGVLGPLTAERVRTVRRMMREKLQDD